MFALMYNNIRSDKMNNGIYQKLVKDIEKEDNSYVKRQLSFVKDKIDKMNMEFPVTTEDILIVLLKAERRLDTVYEETYDESIKNDIETIRKYMDKYFKSTNYDGDIVNSGKLSNGTYFDNFEQEAYLKEKALRIKNKPASIIKAISLICLVVCCAGSIPMFGVSTSLGWYILISGFVGALIFYAIGEALQILHDIRKSLYKNGK